MKADNKFGLLRRLLHALGLSRESTDEVVDWIVDLRSSETEDSVANVPQAPEFPYHLRNNFLTPAELNFYSVLRNVVEHQAVLCAKVSLGDLFWVQKDDSSRYRVFTNKIDRKHVDFLLCDPATMRPLAGIELDDKSHERSDRRSRDEFVDQVFAAAGLPLVHVPAKHGYEVMGLAAQLAPYLSGTGKTPMTLQPISDLISKPPTLPNQAPLCPKCGESMILRTAKSGANVGNRFWGCSKYPNCRSMLPYTG